MRSPLNCYYLITTIEEQIVSTSVMVCPSKSCPLHGVASRETSDPIAPHTQLLLHECTKPPLVLSLLLVRKGGSVMLLLHLLPLHLHLHERVQVQLLLLLLLLRNCEELLLHALLLLHLLPHEHGILLQLLPLLPQLLPLRLSL